MRIKCVTLGSFQTNCYILMQDSSQKTDVLVIDTGLDRDDLANYLLARQIRPKTVILTHGHIDHIGGVIGISRCFADVEVLIHAQDVHFLEDTELNLSYLAGNRTERFTASRTVSDGDVIDLGGIRLQVLHTPGHTPGSISLYVQDQGTVFTGDSLFAGSIGRTDLPGGDHQLLIQSIRQQLLTLPGQTIIFPGHGPSTTIGSELRHNPFLSGS